MQLDFGIIDRDRLKCERAKIARSQVHDLELIILMQAIASTSNSGGGVLSLTVSHVLITLFFSELSALPNEICFSNQILYSTVYF